MVYSELEILGQLFMLNGFGKNSIYLALAVSIALATSLLTAPEVRAEKVLNGAVCAQRVNQLTNSINWQSSVDQAKQIAKKEKKLVLWVNMLGKLEGDT